MTAEQLAQSSWELVPILEGCIEATGCTLQTRTSYIASEIMWAYDFADIAGGNVE